MLKGSSQVTLSIQKIKCLKKLFSVFVFIIPFSVYAQEKGVYFEHGLSWSAVKAKAKAENKFIFMDCFTTWCGPCRYMSSTIFPTEEAGNFMNDKFISVKVQLDTTDNDDADVKSWYQDGHDIAQTYNVRAYPTYLIFDANGNAVHRFVGASPSATVFVEQMQQSLVPEKQYYVLLNQYKAGKKDTAFLHKMAVAAMDSYDMVNARPIVTEYLNTQTDLFTKDNLMFLANFIESSQSKGFEILLKYPSKVDSIIGQTVAKDITDRIIIQEEIYPALPKDSNEKADWASIENKVSEKYPEQASEVVSKAKVIYYRQNNDWNNFQFAIADYLKQYGTTASPSELNEYAWTVFQNCNDVTCIEEALKWSKYSFKDNNEPAFIDTYANLLYKLGRKDEAISWEQKALDLESGDNKKLFEETLEKMKKGEKTWE